MGLPRSCACGQVHKAGERCPVAQARYEKSHPKAKTAERMGKGWETISAKVIARDRGKCQVRLPGCTMIATTADHIRPRSQGGGNQLWNLRAACSHCNSVLGRQLVGR